MVFRNGITYTGSYAVYYSVWVIFWDFVLLGAYGKVSEGVWKDPSTKIEKRVAIKTLRSKSSLQPSPALP